MLGFGGLPNLDEMMTQVVEFKNLFERQVKASEENTRKLDLIIKHLQITDAAQLPVRDAEFTEVK